MVEREDGKVMKEKVYIKGENLIIEVPLKTKRYNPWDDEYKAEMDNIIGVVTSDLDKGLCFRIDMEYKGKDDQWTDFFYKSDTDNDEFIKLCEELDIDIVFTK